MLCCKKTHVFQSILLRLTIKELTVQNKHLFVRTKSLHTYMVMEDTVGLERERDCVHITAVSHGVQWVLFIFLNPALKIKLNRNKALELYINLPSAIQ